MKIRDIHLWIGLIASILIFLEAITGLLDLTTLIGHRNYKDFLAPKIFYKFPKSLSIFIILVIFIFLIVEKVWLFSNSLGDKYPSFE